jgi:nucleolar protein 14
MKSKKGKMKGKSDIIYARKTKVIEKKVNPFELQIRADKFKVLNRKTSHNIGNPIAARQKAFDRRKETIGAEYKVKNKANKFDDKRRKSGFKKITRESIYNLGSEVLTHHGQTLEEVENYDDVAPEEDEMSDEETRLDGNEDVN